MPVTTQHITTVRQSARSGHSDLEIFLKALFGRAPDAFVDVRWRRRVGMGERFNATDELTQVAGLVRLLARRTDVYVGVAPRVVRRGDRGAVAHSFALWADCDTEEASERLAAFSPEPSMVIRSGSTHGRHAYWLLDTPLGIDDAVALNERLAYALRADERCADGARILRPPTTTNHKYQRRQPVGFERFTRAVMPAEQIAAALPRLPAPSTSTSTTTSEQGHSHRPDQEDPLRDVAPEDYVARLCGVAVPRSRKIRCPLHDDHTPSLHVYPTAQAGWYCFGCARGGDIYDLAAALWGLQTRGETFLELRTRLRDLFSIG